jgi:hypothetical protein
MLSISPGRVPGSRTLESDNGGRLPFLSLTRRTTMKTCNDFFNHQPISWDPLLHGSDTCPLCRLMEEHAERLGELDDEFDWIKEMLRESDEGYDEIKEERDILEDKLGAANDEIRDLEQKNAEFRRLIGEELI